jgi:hypothetical protein
MRSMHITEEKLLPVWVVGEMFVYGSLVVSDSALYCMRFATKLSSAGV